MKINFWNAIRHDRDIKLERLFEDFFGLFIGFACHGLLRKFVGERILF